MCSKSNPIVVFALDLMSTSEGEYTIFGLLGQACWVLLMDIEATGEGRWSWGGKEVCEPEADFLSK
jgi:hypothetical protein